MRNNILMFLLLASLELCAGYYDSPKEVQRALVYGADTKLTFFVTDDEGMPMEGVEVIGCFCMNNSGNNPIYKGVTQKDGKCVLKGKSVGEIFYTLKKNRCYETRGRICLYGTRKKPGEVKDGKWIPYGALHKAVIKPIKHPIKMVEHSCQKKIPKENTLIGFDLEQGDFVKPYGTGIVTDFLIFHSEEEIDGNRSISKMKFIFDNALDGAYVQEKDLFSQFKVCYSASTNIVYKKEIVCDYNSSDLLNVKKNRIEQSQYLILRTRTRLDKDGNLIAAHYSRIQGPIKFGGYKIEFYSYYNPNENDLTLESSNPFHP